MDGNQHFQPISPQTYHVLERGESNHYCNESCCADQKEANTTHQHKQQVDNPEYTYCDPQAMRTKSTVSETLARSYHNVTLAGANYDTPDTSDGNQYYSNAAYTDDDEYYSTAASYIENE